MNDFKADYYKKMDAEKWFVDLRQLSNKLNRLKDPKKQNRAISDLIQLYLQLCETVAIHIFALSRPKDNFAGSLFIDNQNLLKFIEEQLLKETKLSKWFLNNYVLGPFPNEKQDLYKDYKRLLQWCMKDYIDEYQLLNAYKHGYRLQSNYGDNHMAISADGKNFFKIAEADCKVTYYSKEKPNPELYPNLANKKCIFENNCSFKTDRISTLSAVLCSMMHNLKLVVTAIDNSSIKAKPIKIILQKNAWSDMIGGSHFKQPIFELGAK